MSKICSRHVLLAILSALMITALLATVIKAGFNSLSDDFKGFGETESWTIAEARDREVLIGELVADPPEISVPGGQIRFRQAWIEERALSTHRLVWFSEERRVGGYRLHFTMDGHDLIHTNGLMFVRDDETGSSVGGHSRSDGESLYLIRLTSSDVSDLRLSLVRKFDDPRPRNIRFLSKPGP